mgnify:CR=1 FL=1
MFLMSRRALLRAHVSFVVLAAVIAPAMAVDTTVSEGSTRDTSVTLHPGDTFTNRGTFESYIGGDGAASIENSGEMRAREGFELDTGIAIEGDLGSFLNSGRIDATGSIYGVGLAVTGDINLFDNRGTIAGGFGGVYLGGDITNSFSNSGEITGVRGAAFVNSGSIANSGTLRATALAGDSAGLAIRDGLINNSGMIVGGYGIVSEASSAGGIEIINSGHIEGRGSVAIDFGFVSQGTDMSTALITSGSAVGRDDILRLLPGSSIVGAVDFGEHVTGDLLDVSQFSGALVLDTVGLEFIKTDAADAVDFSSFTSLQNGNSLIARNTDGRIAIVDAPSATGGGGTTASTVASVTGEISSIISSQLSGIGATGSPASFSTPVVSAYAPQVTGSAAETAVLSALDVGSGGEPGAQAWGTVFGGLSADTLGTPASSVFGGIVAGSHAVIGDGTRVGLLGGYVRSQASIAGTQQLDSHSGIAGIYGQTTFNSLTLELSILGGVSAHHSERDSGGLTAAADFSSWFLAPEAALTIPVLKGDGSGLNVTTRAKYVGGVVAGYTETGGLVNLTLGDQPINLLDMRAELNGHIAVAATEAGEVVLFGSAGLFAQSNLGGSTVQVSILDQPFNAVAPGTVEYGVYGNAGITVPLTAMVDLSASLGGSARSDGLMTASGKLQLIADF